MLRCCLVRLMLHSVVDDVRMTTMPLPSRDAEELDYDDDEPPGGNVKRGGEEP